jgi:ABC-type Mn2+/Zn2+ transport system permease subunit
VLRWVVCGVAAYTAYVSNLSNKLPWAWFFGIVALFFNPFIPIKLDRATWANIDVAVGIALLVSIFLVRENLPKAGGSNARQ